MAMLRIELRWSLLLATISCLAMVVGCEPAATPEPTPCSFLFNHRLTQRRRRVQALRPRRQSSPRPKRLRSKNSRGGQPPPRRI